MAEDQCVNAVADAYNGLYAKQFGKVRKLSAYELKVISSRIEQGFSPELLIAMLHERSLGTYRDAEDTYVIPYLFSVGVMRTLQDKIVAKYNRRSDESWEDLQQDTKRTWFVTDPQTADIF